MKIKFLAWALLILLVLVNIWSILTEIFWLKNTTNILYFLTAIMLVLDNYKKFNKRMYLFLLFTILSYLARSFEGAFYSYELSLVFLSVANTALILEAAKFIEIKNASNYMLLYFIAIIGINSCLVAFHLLEIKEYINSNTVFSLYTLYYINLLILGIIAFIYYLNSYSRKSMYFISLSLGLIFADVLRDMGVFFPKDYSVEVAETIIRLGSAIFVVLFFATKEKQLRLVNMI